MSVCVGHFLICSIQSNQRTVKGVRVRASIILAGFSLNRNAYFGASVRRSSGRRSGGRLLANNIVASIFISLFSFFFPVFLRRDLFSKKDCSDQKTYLAKVAQNAKKPWGRHPDPLCHFGAPWRPFWILQALQAVSERPLRR